MKRSLWAWAAFQIHIAFELLVPHPPNRLEARIEAVVIHRIEVPPVPVHAGVQLLTAWEVETRPGPDRACIAEGVVTVGWIEGNGFEILLEVRGHLVVEHGIGVHLKTQIPTLLHGRQILILGAVLGTHGALLIELAEVEQVVGAIAHIVGTSEALVGRWQPQPGDTSFGQGRRLAAQPVSVLPVGGDVPVEPLL